MTDPSLPAGVPGRGRWGRQLAGAFLSIRPVYTKDLVFYALSIYLQAGVGGKGTGMPSPMLGGSTDP